MNEQEKPFKHPSFYPGDAVETEHPFSLYISVWILLFVLSAFSYMVDLMQVQGYPEMVFGYCVCFSQSGFGGRCFYAYGLGTNGFFICHHLAASFFTSLSWNSRC